MDIPLFSQIPPVVLRKLNKNKAPAKAKKTKTVKFFEESPPEEIEEDHRIDVTSVDDPFEIEKSQPSNYQEKTILKPSIKPSKTTLVADPCGVSDFDLTSCDSTSKCDAIVQTEATKFVSVGTQTTETCLVTSIEGLKNALSSETMTMYKPMYAIPKRPGSEPPLKIGLTLPKGRKRKVFYPDHDEDDSSS